MRKIFLIIIAIFSFNLNAQQNIIYLSGTILDKESNTPLEYATISVFKVSDSIIEYGGITDANGNISAIMFIGRVIH